MRIHILQHSKSTPPGSVIEWMKMRNHDYKVVRLFEGDALPSIDDTDFLIILGGGMNVDDVEKYPWLRDEKAFLRQAVDAKKTCLGLCLGGQLLSQTLGGEVIKHTHWEVGWHPIQLGMHLDSEARLTVFQWHQDTFSLPPGASKVATNRITDNQGFAYGENIVGLQFHPEATEEWVMECIEDLSDYPEGPHVQKPEQLKEGLIFLTPMRRWFFNLLNRMEAVTGAQLKRPR